MKNFSRIVVAVLTVLACGVLGAAGGCTTGVLVLMKGPITHFDWRLFIVGGVLLGLIAGIIIAKRNRDNGRDSW